MGGPIKDLPLLTIENLRFPKCDRKQETEAGRSKGQHGRPFLEQVPCPESAGTNIARGL